MNNVKKFRILTVAICIIAVVGIVCYKNQFGPFGAVETSVNVSDNRTEEQMQSDFGSFIQQVFVEEVTDDSITLNYTVKDKAAYGIEDVDPTLGEVSLDEMKNSMFISENRMASLETFDYDKLTDEQQLIYDIMYTMLKDNLEASDMLEYTESLGPTSGVQAQLPVLLAEYNFYDKTDIDTYISLLGMIPDYFSGIIKLEQQKSADGLFMSDTTAQAIIDQCSDFVKNVDDNYLITVFNKKIKSFEGLSESEIKSYETANEKAVTSSVIPAYQSLIDALNSLKGTGVNENGLCGFKDGKKYYQYLVKVKTGSNRSIDEINQILDDMIKSTQKKMSKIMSDEPNVYYDAQDVEYPYQKPQKAIEHLQEVMTNDFPELPDDITCTVKYIDKSLQDSMSPAFYLTSAIDAYQYNVIYLNNSDKYDLTSAFTTIAHESYPGHLYQNCYFESTNPSHIRSIISVGGYTEGWGTYAELYGYHLAGIDDNVADLLEQNTIATLCVYAKADLGINYLGWDFAATQKYLDEYGFTASQSRTIFDSMVAEPASYMQYTLGYLEIINLKTEALNKLGDDFQIKEFHKFILSIGPAPFSVIEDRMEAWIKAQQKGAQ